MLELHIVIELNGERGPAWSVPPAGNAQPLTRAASDTHRHGTIDRRDPVQCSFQAATGARHFTFVPKLPGCIAQLCHRKLLDVRMAVCLDSLGIVPEVFSRS